MLSKKIIRDETRKVFPRLIKVKDVYKRQLKYLPSCFFGHVSRETYVG